MEDLPANQSQIFFEGLDNSKRDCNRIANRDYIEEARAQGVYGLHYGLARQSVDCCEDGKIVLSESSFAYDGFFSAKYVLIDPLARSAKAWEGQAVNNPELAGRLWQMSDYEYEQALQTVNGLQTNYST